MLFALALMTIGAQPGLAQAVPEAPVPDAPAAAGAGDAGRIKTSDDSDKFKYPEIAKPAAPPVKKQGGADDFPFPGEEKADPAADSATGEKTSPGAAEPAAKPAEAKAADSGFSSSVALHDEGSGAAEPLANPARVRDDAKIARFYWNVGNYEGAYLRYKDAVTYAPEDAEMWFQLAEAERLLGRNVKARADYEHCAALSPTGRRAGEASRWAKKLPTTDRAQAVGPGPKVP